MVKIRLTRTGRKNYATYRVIAIDSQRKRDGKALEYLGHYLPHDKQIELNADRIKYWLSVGAQPSDTVTRLLVKEGIMDKKDLPQKKYNAKPGRKAQEREAAKAEKAAQAKAAAAAPVEEEVAPVEDATEEVVVEEAAAEETSEETAEEKE